MSSDFLRPFIGYRNGQLMVEDLSVNDLARAHGTPLFIYSKATMLRALEAGNPAAALVTLELAYCSLRGLLNRLAGFGMPRAA